MATLKLPSQMAALVDGQRTLTVPAETLEEAFQQLDAVAPMARSQVLEADGRVRRFVGVFVDNRQVRNIREGGALAPNSTITFVMAVAGG